MDLGLVLLKRVLKEVDSLVSSMSGPDVSAAAIDVYVLKQLSRAMNLIWTLLINLKRRVESESHSDRYFSENLQSYQNFINRIKHFCHEFGQINHSKNDISYNLIIIQNFIDQFETVLNE